jgi:hypothetical protein
VATGVTTLAEMRQEILDETGRPKTSLTLVDRRLRAAILWIERNYSLQYMRRYAARDVLTGANGPYDLPGNYKTMRLVKARYTGLDGSIRYGRITKCDPEDVWSLPHGMPSKFWTDGMENLFFNAIPSVTFTAEYLFYRFTPPFVGDTDTHWLFDNARELLLAKTMEFLLPYFEMIERVPIYQSMYNDSLRTLLLWAEEEERVGTDVWMGMDETNMRPAVDMNSGGEWAW